MGQELKKIMIFFPLYLMIQK